MNARGFIGRISKARLAYTFLLPALASYLIFTWYPIVDGLRLAFYRWDGFSPVKEFVGLGNVFMVLQDQLLWGGLKNTLVIAIALAVGLVFLGLGLALVLERIDRRLETPAVTILFIPTIIPLVVIATIFRLLFDPTFGRINSMLREIGLGSLAINWLGDVRPVLGLGAVALFTIIIVMLWQSYGMRMVLYHASLKTMPMELYEAARVDGASGWQLFWYITWPLLWPITSMLTVLTIIGALQVFDLIFLMTGGGPLHATETIGVYMFTQAFGSGGTTESARNVGYAVSVSLVLFAMTAVLTLFNLKVLRRRG